MSKRDIGMEILEGIRDIKAYKAGQKALRVHTLKPPASQRSRVRRFFFTPRRSVGIHPRRNSMVQTKRPRGNSPSVPTHWPTVAMFAE